MQEHHQSTYNEFARNSRLDEISRFYETIELLSATLEEQELNLINNYVNFQLQNKSDMIDVENCLFNPIMPYETIVFNVEELIVQILKINPRDKSGELINEFKPIDKLFNCRTFDPITLYKMRNDVV
jgi:hypothetical protein